MHAGCIFATSPQVTRQRRELLTRCVAESYVFLLYAPRVSCKSPIQGVERAVEVLACKTPGCTAALRAWLPGLSSAGSNRQRVHVNRPAQDAFLCRVEALANTVTLPATLWFFDKGKADDKILFIDARNIFTQVDRSHRELSDEQLQNIALIPRLHKGRRTKFVRLVARYFAQGIARLSENQAHIPALAAQLLAVLGEEDDAVAAAAGRDAVAHLQAQWADLTPLIEAHAGYLREHGADADVDAHNLAQRALQARFAPFFTDLHVSLKQLDKAIRELEKRAAVVAKAAGKVGGEYLSHTLCALQSYFESMAAGSTGQSELGREVIARTKITLPPDDLRMKFGEIVTPMRKQRRALLDQNVVMASVRDALLPRLISGKLKVDHLDIQLPPSMREKVTA